MRWRTRSRKLRISLSVGQSARRASDVSRRPSQVGRGPASAPHLLRSRARLSAHGTGPDCRRSGRCPAQRCPVARGKTLVRPFDLRDRFGAPHLEVLWLGVRLLEEAREEDVEEGRHMAEVEEVWERSACVSEEGSSQGPSGTGAAHSCAEGRLASRAASQA
jgi:hypothetical protein